MTFFCLKDVPHRDPQTSTGRWLETAYALHAAPCRLYAHSLAPGSADDVVQEVFVRLVRFGRKNGAPPREIRPWLLRATRSAAIDLLRSDSRRRRRERERAPTDSLFVAAPHDALVAGETAEALTDLGARTREVVVLRIWGELSFAQIAELVGTSLSTAHEEYHRGISRMRALLAPDEPQKCENNR